MLGVGSGGGGTTGSLTAGGGVVLVTDAQCPTKDRAHGGWLVAPAPPLSPWALPRAFYVPYPHVRTRAPVRRASAPLAVRVCVCAWS